MMKIVPASRRVREASFEPPSSERRRAIKPAGEAVADCVSITAKAQASEDVPRGGGDGRMYQRFVKNRLGGDRRSGHAKHEPGTLRFPDAQLRI
jgi:hypothetical protein